MIWKELSKNESQEICDNVFDGGGILLGVNHRDYYELKLLIENAYNKALDILNLSKENLINCNAKYKFDCYFGKEIYRIFTSDKYRIGEREAANDDIWRFIQVKIIPELIYYRWSDNIKPRIYAQSNRLYLKTLWWFYYLSFNKDLDTTCEQLLKPCNSTDTIVALVERSGKKGYRLDLYREIMKQKCINNLGTEEFRNLMVYNSAKIRIVNPYLVFGGIEEYVRQLIELCNR